MYPVREIASAYFSQREATAEEGTIVGKLANAMDQMYSTKTAQDQGPPPSSYSRGRRWSLDAISPKKLFSRRESIPVTVPDIKGILQSSPPLVPNGDRRHSSPNVKVKGFKFKQSHRFLHLHQQQQFKESYLLLHMDNDDKIVITCEDDSHANSLLFHAMIDKRVRTYRMIVISSRSIVKVDSRFLGQRSRSCEDLLDAKLAAAAADDDDDHEEDDDDDDDDTEIQYSDPSQKVVSGLLASERRFHDSLQMILQLHADKLRLVSLLSKGDSLMLVTAIESLISLSAHFVEKLSVVLDSWDRETALIGGLFSSTVWHFYKDHFTHFLDVSRFLDLLQADTAVKDIHNIEIHQGTLSLENCLVLLVTRISDYGKYLSGLLGETDPSHPDYGDLSAAIANLNTITKEREDENCDEERRPSMDILQEGSFFESGSLNTISKQNNNTPDHNLINNNNDSDEERAKMQNKPRGLSLRRMSAPSALLFKSLSGYKSKSSTSLWSNSSMSKKDQDLVSHFRITEKESTRMLIMEGSVQFAMGMQIQERYLFLFTDLLLVTKQKSSTAFKLKNRVQLCDIWLASCVEEVAETTRPVDQSFVIGWPTQNVVATFPRADIKDYWLTKLREYINMEKLKDKDKQMQLKVASRDLETTTQNVCHVTINNFTQAKEVLQACLNQFNISEHETKDYQLWVLSAKEGSPYPLIGHETPFSIKLSHVRGLSRSKSGGNIDTMTVADLDSHVDNNSLSAYKCDFYLKQKKSTKKNQFDDSAFSKTGKKNKKSPNIFNTLFRKRRPAQHLIFGLPLSEVCDENLDPPESILKLMVLVYQQGPQTPGILRRGNKATLSKEIRDKIDSGEKYLLEDHMAPTAASVFKEFLRSIPEGLLVNDLCQQWTTIKKDDSRAEKITKIKTILMKLPQAHYRLLKLTISLLQHLAKYSTQNHMGPSNLATCIAPSFYAFEATASPPSRLKGESLKQMQMQNSVNDIQNVFVPLISFMIVNHVELFGEDILTMFTKYGCQASPQMNLHEDRQELQMQPSLEEDEQEEMIIEEEHDEEISYGQHPKKHHMLLHQQRHERMQQDSNSGTDSDSMHSVLSMQDTGMGFRNNDSSTDSLVDREFFTPDADSSPKAVKSHISPSNLSRDSGLTLSDTQLYDDEAFHAEGVSTSAKVYQRSTSHVTENDYNQNIGSHYSKHVNPIAPPRKRSSKTRRDSSGGSDTEQYAFPGHRSPFKYSITNLQQDSNSKSDRSGELRQFLAHPLLSQRVSSDSIGEEDELDDQFCPADFDRSRTSDKYVVIKSENRASLLLAEDSVSTKYKHGSSGSKSKHRFVRQSSVIDNTPPVSPQSRHSQSSHDSVISDSTYSVSQDGSVHSAPQTPDEPAYKSLVWMPGSTIPGKPWNEKVFAHNLNVPHSMLHSKSTSDLLHVAESTNVDLLQSVSQEHYSFFKLWPGKFHEAEEIEMRSPNLRQNLRPNSYHSTDLSFSVLHTSPQHDKQSKKHWFASHFDKGSPPPKVILQTLQTPLRQETLPVRAGHDHTSVSDAESKRFSFDPRMSSVRQEEYVSATSRPIIIAPPGNTVTTADSVASRRARLSKYLNSLDVPSSLKGKESVIRESKRPDKPPNYHEAIERKLKIKHNVPLDTANAKTALESKQIGSEIRNVKCTMPNTTSIHNSEDLYSGTASTGSENSDSNKCRFNTGSSETLSPLGKHSISSDHTDAGKLLPSPSTNNSTTVLTKAKSQSVSDSPHPSKVSSSHLNTEKSNNKPDYVNNVTEHDNQNANAMMKNPEKLYLQSVQIYEQNSSTPVTSMVTPLPVTHPQQSVESAIRLPQKSSSSSLQESNTHRAIESGKSRFQSPHANLYRTHSVSAEHLHNLGVFSSLSAKSRSEAVNHSQILTQSSSHQPNTEFSNDLKLKTKPRDIKAEIQQNFLKARSYFSQSQDDQNISSAPSEYHLSLEPSQGNKLSKWSPKSLKSAVSTEDMTVQSASALEFKTRLLSKGFHPANSALMEHKREIHWSVKDLKTIYDKSHDTTDASSNKQSTSGISQPRSPPPYQNPPPFKSIQKSDHVTSSSKTSDTLNSQKHGPQSFMFDTNCSYSSSDTSCISSLDRNSVRSSGSSNNSETLSDYTNITYV